MNKTQIKNAINNAMCEFSILRHLGNFDVLREMEDYQRKQQRIMKNAAPYGTKLDSLSLVARYFVAKNLIDAVDNPQHFRARDILHCQRSYLLAHALLDAYPEKVAGAVESLRRYVPEFESLTYTCGEIVTREEVAA
jgi:hypothetical protein